MRCTDVMYLYIYNTTVISNGYYVVMMDIVLQYFSWNIDYMKSIELLVVAIHITEKLLQKYNMSSKIASIAMLLYIIYIYNNTVDTFIQYLM